MRLLSLAAVAFSAASAVDAYAAASGVREFCGEGGGCDAVAASAAGQLLGPWLPQLGLSAYTFVLAGSLFELTRRAALWVAVLGGLGGLGLVGLQVSMGHFCQLCLGADVSAFGIAACGVFELRRGDAGASGALGAASWPLPAWAALYVLAIGIPPAYAASKPTPVPAAVRAMWQPGKINVIEFSDFECPYCRKLHPVLTAALEPYAGRVHLERRSYPLSSHAHASGAAAAHICARIQGKAEAMAHELFARADISKPAREVIARDIGLDVGAFNECVDDAQTHAEVKREMELVEAAGMQGLPTVWIGQSVVLGFDASAGEAPYRSALAMAEAGQPAPRRLAPWLWVFGTSLALAALTLRRRRD